MARIATVSPENIPAGLKDIVEQIKQQYGTLPGVYRIFLADPNVGGSAGQIYHYLNLRSDSPFTKVQREMLATVVNGLVGGAP